jgi:hypothetical protein
MTGNGKLADGAKPGWTRTPVRERPLWGYPGETC